MAFLLDTNAWIHYLKDPASPIRAKLAKLTPADIAVCSVVKAELLHGAKNTGNGIGDWPSLRERLRRTAQFRLMTPRPQSLAVFAMNSKLLAR